MHSSGTECSTAVAAGAATAVEGSTAAAVGRVAEGRYAAAAGGAQQMQNSSWKRMSTIREQAVKHRSKHGAAEDVAVEASPVAQQQQVVQQRAGHQQRSRSCAAAAAAILEEAVNRLRSTVGRS